MPQPCVATPAGVFAVTGPLPGESGTTVQHLQALWANVGTLTRRVECLERLVVTLARPPQ